MKKKDNVLTIVLFGVVLAIMSIGSLFFADKNFSVNENRTLQLMPPLTVEDVLSGEFEKQFEKYENDQIIGRDGWILIKTHLKAIVGSKDIQGVYLGKDGYLLEKLTDEDVDEEQFEKNVMAIKKVYDRLPSEISKSVMMVPPAGLVLTDKLPLYAPMLDGGQLDKKATAILKNYQCIEICEAMKKAADTEDVFYKTDHHWTTGGAQIAFKRYVENVGVSMLNRGNWSEVSDSFQGTHYSKILLDRGKDKVEIYQPQRNSMVEVKADGKSIGGIFQKKYLKEKDKYAVFFGGNYGLLEMTGGPKNGRRLLLIKDSYANSFAPFCIDVFREVDMIDLRYFRGDVEAYIKEKGITDILTLYSMSNMTSDENIRLIGQQGVILK